MFISNINKEFFDYLRRRKAIKEFTSNEMVNPGDYYSTNAFDYYKCIFVHIPKTAGVSITKTLFGNLAGGHNRITDYQNIFSPLTFNKYFKFCFVRNPWDRLYSAFKFLKSGGFNKKDEIWSQNNLSGYEDFKTFVDLWLNPNTIYNTIHFTPQFEFIIKNDEAIGVDYIGHLESIESDFALISKKLGINKKLVHLNKAKQKKNYKNEYNSKTIDKVAKIYKRDIDLFGYEF